MRGRYISQFRIFFSILKTDTSYFVIRGTLINIQNQVNTLQQH